MNRLISIVLIIGIVGLVNLLSKQFFFRWDVTENRQYTLSEATRNVLKGLEDPVTIDAFFSKDMPANFEKVRKDFQDMLIEYNTISRGNIDYNFVNPNESPETEQQAVQAGVQPVIINVREKDQATQKKAFMGAVLSYGDQKEIIPFISQETAMEYDLTTMIKKMTVVDKPSIAFIQGHGEPDLQQLAAVMQDLAVIFSVETIDLNVESSIPDRFSTVAVVAPQDSFPQNHFDALDDYLARGGKVIMALNAVQGDFSTAQGSAVQSNVFSWMSEKGIQIEPSFMIDEISASVTVQQQQGFFRVNTQVQFPYFPMITNFGDHPVVKGLEQVIFQFGSPVTFVGDTGSVFTPILQSSQRAGILSAPTFFDVQKKWSAADFPLSNVTMAGVLEGNVQGNSQAKLVVFGDGDFPTGQAGRGGMNDNANMFVNTVEWLTDDTGLNDLRTKAVLSRPIDELEDGKRSFLKYLNFFLPIALVLLYGFFRSQRNRNRRIRRMQERYV